ncbi:unnamed protein product [Lota lota]
MRNCSLWAFLPICFSICTAIGLIVGLFINIDNNVIKVSYHIQCVCYVLSIAGNRPPASCVFSEVMNLAAFMGFIIGFLRYLQLKPKVRKPWLNIASLATFSLACFGMTLVGNFQWSNDEDIHNTGTSLTFGLGTVFCWLQSIATLRLNLRNEGRRVGIVRFVLSVAITLSMLLYFTLMLRGLHIHAARTQWCLIMFLLVFISTLAVEFRHFHFEIVCTDHQEPPLSLSDRFSVVSEDHSNTTMQTQDHPGYF